ncbi:MAG: hypothetical protein ACREBN_02250 [Burkholderiaceae bacterium]
MNSKVPCIASVLAVAITVAASSAYAHFDEFEWTGVESDETSAFEANYPVADATEEADTSDAPLTYFPASLFPEALSYEVDEYIAAEKPLDIVAAIDPLQVP